LIPVPALRAWEAKRTLPEWQGGEFRSWFKSHKVGAVAPNRPGTGADPKEGR
jgi:hypothetical protein